MVDKPKKKRKIRIGYTNKKFTREKIKSLMKSQLYIHEYPLVMLAYDFALYGHRGDFRKDMAEYFEHCKSVALIIMLEFKVFLAYPIIVGFLHDIKEDSHILSWWSIQRIFGRVIYRGLRIITKEDDKDYFLDVFEGKVPVRFKYLPDYIRGELEFACNKVRKKLSMPKSIAFKRVN